MWGIANQSLCFPYRTATIYDLLPNAREACPYALAEHYAQPFLGDTFEALETFGTRRTLPTPLLTTNKMPPAEQARASKILGIPAAAPYDPHHELDVLVSELVKKSNGKSLPFVNRPLPIDKTEYPLTIAFPADLLTQSPRNFVLMEVYGITRYNSETTNHYSEGTVILGRCQNEPSMHIHRLDLSYFVKVCSAFFRFRPSRRHVLDLTDRDGVEKNFYDFINGEKSTKELQVLYAKTRRELYGNSPKMLNKLLKCATSRIAKACL